MSDEQLREDELASAYLDGEATPAEIAEVEASDALLARVEEFRALRDAVAESVMPLPQDRQDDLIGAALGVADAEEAARPEAEVVPLQRPRRLLLAMAAVVVLLAAVVGTGLIASRGGGDFDESATLATAMTESAAGMDTADDAAPAEEASTAEEAPMAEEEPMAEMDMATADEEMAAETAMAAAGEEMAVEMDISAADETVAAEASMAEEERRSEPAEATTEAAVADGEETPATTTTIAAAATTDGAPADDSRDVSSEQVVDLGTLESLDSLLEDVEARWSAALEEGAMADSGACAGAVQEQAIDLGAETIRAFVVTVGSEDPVTFDARFARRDDGTAVIVYAAPPDCEIGVHELPDS